MNYTLCLHKIANLLSDTPNADALMAAWALAHRNKSPQQRMQLDRQKRSRLTQLYRQQQAENLRQRHLQQLAKKYGTDADTIKFNTLGALPLGYNSADPAEVEAAIKSFLAPDSLYHKGLSQRMDSHSLFDLLARRNGSKGLRYVKPALKATNNTQAAIQNSYKYITPELFNANPDLYNDNEHRVKVPLQGGYTTYRPSKFQGSYNRQLYSDNSRANVTPVRYNNGDDWTKRFPQGSKPARSRRQFVASKPLRNTRQYTTLKNYNVRLQKESL